MTSSLFHGPGVRWRQRRSPDAIVTADVAAGPWSQRASTAWRPVETAEAVVTSLPRCLTAKPPKARSREEQGCLGSLTALFPVLV